MIVWDVLLMRARELKEPLVHRHEFEVNQEAAA